MDSHTTTSLRPYGGDGDFLHLDSLEFSKLDLARPEHFQGLAPGAFAYEDNSCPFWALDKRADNGDQPSNLYAFYINGDESYRNPLDTIRELSFDNDASESSLSSFFSSENCGALERSISLPYRRDEMKPPSHGFHDDYNRQCQGNEVGDLVSRKTYPFDTIARVNGANFQMLSAHPQMDNLMNDMEEDDLSSSSFDGSQIAKTRRSRARLNHHLDRLRKLLPPPQNNGCRKESKSNLIQRACRYIVLLQQQTRRQYHHPNT